MTVGLDNEECAALVPTIF